MCAARSATDSRTGRTVFGEFEIKRRISLTAVFCSSASSRSRIRRAISVSWSVVSGRPRGGGFVGQECFGVAFLWRRTFSVLLPAIERRCIAFLRLRPWNSTRSNECAGSGHRWLSATRLNADAHPITPTWDRVVRHSKFGWRCRRWVIRARSIHHWRSRHVRFAPKADNYAGIPISPLSAITGREQVQQPACVATSPTRSPRRRERVVSLALQGQAPSRF